MKTFDPDDSYYSEDDIGDRKKDKKKKDPMEEG